MSQARWGAALAQLAGSVALVCLSVLLLAYSPWFFLPVAWVLAGASLSLLFIIGHDCAHRSAESMGAKLSWALRLLVFF